MRLQRISTNYPIYLNQFYSQRPGLEARPYAVQHAALLADCYGWADFWSAALGKLGYETSEIIANVEPMQKRWARENGIAYDEGNGTLDIVKAQVRAFQPEVLFVNDHYAFNAAYLQQLKAENASIKLVIGWCGAPYTDASVFRAYDLVLSCIPEMVEEFRRNGHRAYHINHAFEPRILEKIDVESAADLDFSFIGSIIKRDQFHKKREELILELIEKTGLQIWSNLARASRQQHYSARARQLAYDGLQAAQRIKVPQALLTATPLVRRIAQWQERPAFPEQVDERILRRAHPPLYGLAMFQKLRESKIAFNNHIDISNASASNIRLYEATGVGACLLTDWKENLPELFEPETEVVTYRSVEECVEKVEYLLDHEGERQAIAASGQRRTLRDHTFTQRAAQLDRLIRSVLCN